MKQKLKILFTIFCLTATSVVTIATSSSSQTPYAQQSPPVLIDDHPQGTYPTTTTSLRKIYLVASNCPDAQIYQERITVEGGRITEPRNLAPTHFGLPTYDLSFNQNTQISGYTQNQQIRTCVHSRVTQGYEVFDVYSCYENNYLRCQVSFQLESTY